MRRGVLGGCLVALAIAAPAVGAAWLPAAVVTTSGETAATNPAVAVARNGTAVVAWIATLTGGNHAVRIATRPAGAGFGNPTTIQSSASGTYYRPAVAINAHGDVIVAWTRDSTTYVAMRPYRGLFNGPTAVPNAPYSGAGPRVAIDSSGSGTLAEAESHSDVDNGCSQTPLRKFLRAAVYPIATNAAVASAKVLATTTGCLIEFPDLRDPALAVNAGGDAVVALGIDGGTRIYSRALAAGTLTQVTSVASATAYSADISDTGRYAVALATTKVSVMLGTAGGAPGAPIDLTGPASIASTAVGLDNANNLLAAWDVSASGERAPFLRAVAADGTLGPASPAGPQHPDPEAVQSFDVGGPGSAFLLWRAPSGPTSTYAVNAVVRSPAGVVGSPAIISGDLNQASSTPVVGADDHGGALAAFVRPDGTANRVMFTQFDGVAPVLSAISGPSSVQTGDSAAYSVTASDDWSGATVHWDFGDGATADGLSVSHTFATAGTPAVTATATDAAGNAQSQTLAVTVAAPGSGSGGGSGSGASGDVANAPKLTKVVVTPNRFAVARAATAVIAAGRHAPRGARIRFSLAAPATTVLRFQRAASGRRGTAGHCVKPTRKLRRARRCTRWVAEGSLTRKGLGAGAGSIAFSGRIGRRALTRGRHRVTIRATGVTGLKAPARTARFQIVRG